MSHTIKITKTHRRILLEALLASYTFKEKKLKNPSSLKTMTEMYNDAGEKISSGEISCGRIGTKATDNMFGWLIDQFYHSGKLTETEFGKLAISICEAAGNNTYESFCRMTIINTLFE